MAIFPAAKTTPDSVAWPEPEGVPRASAIFARYRNAAEGDPPAAIAGRQPVAVQLEVQRLAALRRQLRLKVDLAIERHAGQPRPRRQIGQMHAEHAAGQQRGEIDIQIAIDAAAGPL